MTKSVVGSVSTTIVSVLDTVNTTTTQLTKGINAIGKSVDMFDRYMTVADLKHQKETEIELDFYIENLKETKAFEHMERQYAIQQKLKANPEMLKLYTENYQRIEKLIDNKAD